ncbi:arylformamidase [Kordiimonas sp. SCSIO 12603]|uniref:arylformamidase n=1 Tax=Kordiimonas sp. SCSIO 12603 TaxID=2829596 RepID=UPI002105B68E|nr:arylformamidase [Kordiimonas sp. SCSIO 12603]UTW59214.1 arylformamidase [Kordiimonas sp. SCSIO 12603]
MTKTYDISQTLSAETPMWPGDTPFGIEATWEIEDGCPVLVSKLTLSTHSGAHADAPSHYDKVGKDIADVPLETYMGDCVLVYALDGTGDITLEELKQQLDKAGTLERVLIRTFETFPHHRWPEGFRAVGAELIQYLAEQGCRLIGVDTPSLDPETSKDLHAHMAVKENGMAILEGLVLDDVPEGEYELIALPLKIKGADASPVRAVLRSK